MTTLQYTLRPVAADCDWEENLYHAVVPVRGGTVETDDPLTVQALLTRGFDIVAEPPVATRRTARKSADPEADD